MHRSNFFGLRNSGLHNGVKQRNMRAMSDPKHPQGTRAMRFPAKADRAAAQFMHRVQADETSPEGVLGAILTELKSIGDRLAKQTTLSDVLLYAAVLGRILQHLETHPRKNLPPQLARLLEKDLFTMSKNIAAMAAGGLGGEARQMKHALGRILGMRAHLGIGDVPPRTVVPQ